MLMLEGLLPLLSPTGWRKMFEQMLKMNDGQIRFFGLCSLLLGGLVAALWWAFQ